MLKKTKNISINILTAVVILLSLLLVATGVTNAWFTTDGTRKLKLVFNVGQLNVKLYQTIGEEEIEVFTNSVNENAGNSAKYITLTDEILPDQVVDLNLTLKNEDKGAGVYIRYQFALYACGVEEDILIPIDIQLPENETVVKDGDYFYYTAINTDASGNVYRDKTKDILFEKTGENPKEIQLIDAFTVPLSSFLMKDAGGEFILNGSETLKLLLNIEGSSIKFAE